MFYTRLKVQKKEVWDNNYNDKIVKDFTKRIYVWASHNDYHKQLLLGFMNEKSV
jgi:hypothetical protein